MVSREKYDSIRKRILVIVEGADTAIDPSDVLRQLRQEGTPRSLASTVMLEMTGSGQIHRRAEDWYLSPSNQGSNGATISAPVH